MFITLAALVPPVNGPARTVQLWALHHAACEPVDFYFPCLTNMCHVLTIAISLRPAEGLICTKGFLPYAVTASNEFLKNCFFNTKHLFSFSVTM